MFVSSLSRVALRYSNSAGIKVVGDHNTLSELLILDTDWLGTLDYPPLEIGFGLDSDAAPGPDAEDEDGSVDSVGARRNATELAPQVGMAMFPRNTQGRNNTVTRVTVGRFGNAGIVTSQVIPPIGAEGLNRRPPAGACRLFLGPGFGLAARWTASARR